MGEPKEVVSIVFGEGTVSIEGAEPHEPERGQHATVEQGFQGAEPERDIGTGGFRGQSPMRQHATVEQGAEPPEPLFDMGKKKKKKRGKFVLAELEGDVAPIDVISDLDTWTEYNYPDLLERIYEKLREREGGGANGGHRGRQLVIIPPHVFKLGSKKTCFSNFAEIAKRLNRDPQHLQEYLLVELGTTGTIDGTGSLVIKGKYGRGDVEGVLKRYIAEYIRCQTCRSHDTRMERDKESRLMFLKCNACTAESTVSKVKGGFNALTEKRSRIRQREGK